MAKIGKEVNNETKCFPNPWIFYAGLGTFYDLVVVVTLADTVPVAIVVLVVVVISYPIACYELRDHSTGSARTAGLFFILPIEQ